MPNSSQLQVLIRSRQPGLTRVPWFLGRGGRLTLGLLLLGACQNGEGLLLPSEGQPATIEVARGNGQSGRVGEPLADPVVVRVTDKSHRPVQGVSVTFELTPAGPGAEIDPGTAVTDAAGEAGARVLLGTTIGRQLGEARILTNDGTLPPRASFAVMAVPENANSMAAVGGQDQTGRVGAPLGQRLVIQVTDAFGNPIAGIPINWEAQGGGSVSQSSMNTDDQGLASVERILGPAAGPQTTVATSEGLAGSPVTFLHTALAGDASLLTIVSGDNQTGQAGSQLPAELVVRLVDGDGNGVPNTAVAWVVATGGGSVTPGTSNTDGDGRASARWTLGAAGANRLDAVVSGVSVVSFEAMATTAVPAAVAIITQPSSVARNGVRLDRQPVIQLRDGSGNPVARAGIQVSAALGSGSGILMGTRQRITDATGRVTFTDLAIIGPPGRYTLVFASSGFASATSAAIDLSAVPTVTTITGDSPDPTAPGAAFTVQFRVTSPGPVPAGTVTVSDGVQGCTGTLSNGAGVCQLALSTAGDRTLTATYAGGMGLTGSSDTELHRVQTPPPQNMAPTADYTSQCEDLTCRFTDRSSDPDGSIASRSWSFGDGSGGSSEKDPTHTFPASGTYTVTLTVTDNDGATAVTSRAVTVQAAPSNQPPTAAFSADCRDLGCSFNSDASRDPDGKIVGWSWNFGDGTSSDQKNPQHGYGTAGTYTVTLTVTDDAGSSGSVAHDVTVNAPPPPPNNPPHAEFSVSCADLTCSFSDESRDDDGTVVSWSWDFGDGSGSTDQSPSHQYSQAGKYKVTLTVTDNRGDSESKSHDVEAKAPAPAGTTVTITGDSPDPSDFGAPITVSFTVASSAGTPGGTVLVTEPNGGSCSGSAPSGSCTMTPGGSGTRQITATYQGNSSFAASSDTDEHTVGPPPPAGTTTAITGHSPDPSDPGQNVTVSVAVTSGAGTPAGTVAVTVGDEPESCSATLDADGTGSCSLALTNPGTHTLTATYQGNSSFSGSSDSTPHTVNPPPGS